MDLPSEDYDSQVTGSVEKPPDESKRRQRSGQEAGYIEEILGLWDVKYPGSDGLILESHIERVEFRRDCTYTWRPTPAWASETGEFGIIKTEDGFLKLGIKDTHGRWRWGYLVLMKIGKVGSYFMNWTRTRGDAVLFADRIWRADRPRDYWGSIA